MSNDARKAHLAEKRAAKKAQFDKQYDQEKTHFDDLKDMLHEQASYNKSAFGDEDDESRIQYEGFRPGLYVRIELKSVPYELVEHFNPKFPLILGGLLQSEEAMGFIRLRFKKHRWHKKILKTRDPVRILKWNTIYLCFCVFNAARYRSSFVNTLLLTWFSTASFNTSLKVVLSIGWRRFQTIPLYACHDRDARYRALKYTPEHAHCVASLYGPVVPPSTGCLAVQSISERVSHFRIAGTGVVMEHDKTSEYVIDLPQKCLRDSLYFYCPLFSLLCPLL